MFDYFDTFEKLLLAEVKVIIDLYIRINLLPCRNFLLNSMNNLQIDFILHSIFQLLLVIAVYLVRERIYITWGKDRIGLFKLLWGHLSLLFGLLSV